MALVSGQRYKIVSCRSAMVLTVALGGGFKVQGDLDKNLDNQIWIAQSLGGDSWAFKSVYKYEGHELYLSYDGPNTPGSLIVGSTTVRSWDLRNTNFGGANYSVWLKDSIAVLIDLYGGDVGEGSTIQLWSANGTASQYWLFQKAPEHY